MEMFAYLDPSTGSLFIQVLIGSVFAGAVVFRGFMHGTLTKVRETLGRAKAVDRES